MMYSLAGTAADINHNHHYYIRLALTQVLPIAGDIKSIRRPQQPFLGKLNESHDVNDIKQYLNYKFPSSSLTLSVIHVNSIISLWAINFRSKRLLNLPELLIFFPFKSNTYHYLRETKQILMLQENGQLGASCAKAYCTTPNKNMFSIFKYETNSYTCSPTLMAQARPKGRG